MENLYILLVSRYLKNNKTVVNVLLLFCWLTRVSQACPEKENCWESGVFFLVRDFLLHLISL